MGLNALNKRFLSSFTAEFVIIARTTTTTQCTTQRTFRPVGQFNRSSLRIDYYIHIKVQVSWDVCNFFKLKILIVCD